MKPSMKTWMAKTDEVEKKWWIVDMTDKTVGRAASEIAKILRGKHKAQFTPHTDTGDFVVVVNSDKMRFSGTKWNDKTYYWHGRNMGSVRDLKAFEMRDKHSSEIIKSAVRGMLPKNHLGRQMLKKLKAYEGTEHPHMAQKPEAVSL